MVRGPMIADGHARVVDHEGDGELDQGHAGLVGQLGQLLDDVELALVRRQDHVEPGRRPRGDVGVGGGVLAPAAGQPATGQRAVGQRAHPVPQRRRQHVLLDAADQDRVRRLLGDEPFEVRSRAAHWASTIWLPEYDDEPR